MPKAATFVPPLIAVLLGCSALSNAAQAGWFSAESKPPAPVVQKDDKPKPLPAVTLDDSIREAQMLRLAGNYQEALTHLSQLMLVAADDAHVIAEYGKTLASMGRADEAEKFLTRAQELQPDEWSIYSALGVAYDEIGNQRQAQVNYEHALALKPGEPSVLNNYALSRMLAQDPAMARKLADRAELANASAKDEKIARNIAMIRSTAPAASEGIAANTPAPGTIVPPVTAPVPHAAVATTALPPVRATQPSMPAAKPAAAASSATAKPAAVASGTQAQPQKAQSADLVPPGVVMQRVPVDPLAGPVRPKEAAVATHEPRVLQPKPPADSSVNVAAKADASKPVAAAPKPQAVAQAKPVLPAAKVSLTVKAEDVKPNAAQATPVKAADAKPQDGKAKPAPSKDGIPGLRLSANAY